MKIHHLACILALALLLPACGKDKAEEKAPATSEVAPDRGPVDLDGMAKDQAKGGNAARTNVPRGYDPAKWDKLPEATKKIIARDQELARKAKENPNMTDSELMKAARGGEPQKQYKF